MSNLEVRPPEVTAGPDGGLAAGVEVLAPRDVPLGGPRAMTVRRTLPQRGRTFVGAWCFVDHYGPDDVAATGGMRVPPHPHTGLQTVSWLFAGEIEHRDSAGHSAMVRPGELNLMTAGRGISHSEVSTPATSVLHGVQLWVALPRGARGVDPGFRHYAPPVVEAPGLRARVFLGSAFGATSPVATHTPLLGAEVVLDAGATVRVAVDEGFEHGVLVDTGPVTVDGTPVTVGELAHRAPGSAELTLAAPDGPARLVLLGGPPFGEQVVMWWNFLGTDHDEIAAFRASWQAAIGAPDGSSDDGPARFTLPDGDPLPPLPAPLLPGGRLRPRG
jgi:quercetin 2,3-dioxygenase